eukprot:9996745-Alexandrium_andersonii.AAC.1
MHAPPICFLRVAQDCRILRNHMRLRWRPHRGPRRCPAAGELPENQKRRACCGGAGLEGANG